MSPSARRRRRWPLGRRRWRWTPPSRWTLRTRLLAATIALLAAVSLIIGLVSVLALDRSLLDQVDRQLDAAVKRADFGGLLRPPSPPPGLPPPVPDCDPGPRLLCGPGHAHATLRPRVLT